MEGFPHGTYKLILNQGEAGRFEEHGGTPEILEAKSNRRAAVVKTVWFDAGTHRPVRTSRP